MDSLGTSEQERDDSFAWLENLAARQGATEGLLTTPEERMEEEPDWVKRAKGLSTEDVPTQPAPAAQPSGNLEELGKSEQERDDSFAWLESLAARQGASEGLLTKPEERMEEEPDWVKRAKDVGLAAEQPPTSSPPPAVEEPSSIDDTAAWLKSLDQEESKPVSSKDTDATGMWLKSLDEGLVKIQPEQPVQEPEPEIPAWMQNIGEEQPAEASAPSAPIEEAAAEATDWMRSIEEPAEGQPSQAIEQPEPEIPAWMKSDEEEKTPESESAIPVSEMPADRSEIETAQPAQLDEISDWMQSTEEPQTAQASPTAVSEVEAEQPAPLDDLPEWMQHIEDKETTEEGTTVTHEEMATEVSEWMGSIEEPVTLSDSSERVEEKPTATSEEIPAWLSSLEEEEAQATTPTASDADLPAWLRGEEGVSLEPSELEPTRPTDWQPAEEEQPQPTAPVSEAIPESFEATQEMPEPALSSLEEKETAAPVSEPAPEPHKEPVAQIDEAISTMPVDPILGQARDDLARGDISGALNTYGKLIKKTRLLDEVIYDLREALYRYPVEVSIWQSLGDAYMRANRLQDALDAYTKAEELLR
jgi:hypothetical protein